MKYTLRNTLILFITILSIGCTKDLKRDIKDLSDRLDNIESGEIASLSEQVNQVNGTLAALRDLDQLLLERLDNMPDTSQMRKELEVQRQQLQKAIDALKAYVDGENTNVKSWANSLFATLDALKELKSYVDNGDSSVKAWANNLFATIESLKTLKQYADDNRTGVEDWVKASYTTLTMHNLLAEVVAELKAKLDKLPDASTLDSQFKTLENSMKSWVNSQLSGYMTITEAEARLSSQKKQLEDKISILEAAGNDNAADIKKLQDSVQKLNTAVARMKIEITNEYQDAISKAIKDYDGKVDAKIAEKLKAVNSEIATLKQQISGITSRINDLESELTKLKGRISSLTYIPTHEDGKARVVEIQSSTIHSEYMLSLDFTVRPASAAKYLKEKKKSLSVKYMATPTAGSSMRELPIDSIVLDKTNESCITVYVDAKMLPTDFVAEEESASLMLEVKDSDTGNDIASPFIPLALQRISSYLTFKSEGSSTLHNGSNYSPNVKLYYSYDLRTWKEWNHKNFQLRFSSTEPLYIYGDNPTQFNNQTTYFVFGTNGDSFSVEGNIMALKNRYSPGEVIPDSHYFNGLFENNANLKDAKNLLLPATSLVEGCYFHMFYNCTSLETAPELPATTLAESCYDSMFFNCQSLKTAPSKLPAKTLAESCYGYMFARCSSLETAPELPATTLAKSCYQYMFFNCHSLKVAPELPATTLAEYCYYCMFSGCRSLKTAPELPATTLAAYCYQYIFYNCSSLKTVPELPATTLAERCYYYMFANCSSLETAPVLSATTLAEYCYFAMFSYCTSLKTAPKLPATTLAKACYYFMFSNCTSLKTAPVLSATTLAEYCYFAMFRDCTSLKTAPELPAETLVTECYSRMFESSGVTSVKCHATSFNSNDPKDFLAGVPAGGTFYGKTDKSAWSSYIPTGWTYVKF